MRVTPGKATATLLLSLVLTGCPLALPDSAEPEPPPVGEALEPVQERDEASEALNYYRFAAELSEAGVENRIRRLEPMIQGEQCSRERVRLAVLFSRLPEGIGDDRSQALLTPCLEDPFARHSGLGAFAALLDDVIASRQARRDVQEAATRAEREARQQAEELTTLQETVDALEEQLEGLKAIERSIQERDRQNQ